MPIIYYEFDENIQKELQEKIDNDNSKKQILPKSLNFYWDIFYKHHKLSFFHHRHYLQKEFLELNELKQDNKYIFTEYGCGVGNTIYPLKEKLPVIQLFQGLDFSKKAIEWASNSPEFCQKTIFEVCDLVQDPIPQKFEKCNLGTLIFTLSAIQKQYHKNVITKIYNSMQNEGVLYFRDYGKYDFGQIKMSIKKNKKIEENFYQKEDGICVNYFQEDEINKLMESVGFKKLWSITHHRYQENRKKEQKMFRVWVAGRYKKVI